MNRFFLIGFFCMLCSIGHAQLPLVFNEQFNDNSNLWPVGDEANYYKSEIKNGTYYIQHKKNTVGLTFYATAPFDPALDYEIETKITLNGGNNYGYGLYAIDQRSSKVSQEHNFMISGNGYYKLYSYDVDGKEITHKDWVQHSAIHQDNQANILTIKKTGKLSAFFINGTEVFSQSNLSYWGSSMGIIVYDTVTVKIDYFTIKQNRGKINTIENKLTFQKENLGPTINSKIQDVTPVISHDGKTLYFSVRSDEADEKNNYNSEIFYSDLSKDGKWSTRKNIGHPLNNDQSNFIISATPDNNSLMLSGRYNKDGTSYGDGFSISHRERKGWSVPEDIIVDDYYNESEFASFCLSADRKAIIQSIERKDSYGKVDLYVSFEKANNTWTAPKNLGATINTFASEETPFLAADGKTLYFSSNGHLGYGSSDIFMSRRLDDSWTRWSKPVNLGPQINTKEWDAYYTIPASGDYAYLVSAENSMGGADIFRIKVAESAKPEPVVIIHGKVLDKNTKQPIGATIDYHELSTGKDAGSARSNPVDGTYKIILPYGKAYGFLAEKTNFLSESDNIDLATIKQYTEIERDLYLSPIEIGKSITMKNVFFVRSKSELLPDSFAELDRLTKILKDNPELKIELSGHTDNVGDPALNIKLSEDRVLAIKNYLISKSISAKRLTGKGYGGSKPVASNDTEETRKLNRRVEFVIVGK